MQSVAQALDLGPVIDAISRRVEFRYRG